MLLVIDMFVFYLVSCSKHLWFIRKKAIKVGPMFLIMDLSPLGRLAKQTTKGFVREPIIRQFIFFQNRVRSQRYLIRK